MCSDPNASQLEAAESNVGWAFEAGGIDAGGINPMKRAHQMHASRERMVGTGVPTLRFSLSDRH